MADRVTVPVLVIADVWSVLVVKVMEVTEAVALHVALVTDWLPVAVPRWAAAPAPDRERQPGNEQDGRRGDRPACRVAEVLHGGGLDAYWLVATPVRCCSVKV